MKVISEVYLRDFNAWSGAESTKQRIIQEGKADEFDSLMEELYPDGLTDTLLNDILWFEPEWVFENLGIKDEEEQTLDCNGVALDVEDEVTVTITDGVITGTIIEIKEGGICVIEDEEGNQFEIESKNLEF